MIEVSQEIQRACEAAAQCSPIREAESYQLFSAPNTIGNGALILWKRGHDFPRDLAAPGMLLPIIVQERKGYLCTLANAELALREI